MSNKKETRASQLERQNIGYRDNNVDLNLQTVQSAYYDLMRILVLNRFTWTGLPDGIEGRWIEQVLFEEGSGVFYYDYAYGRFMFLPYAQQAGYNVYHNPTVFRPVIASGYGYMHDEVTAKDAVPVFASASRSSLINIVKLYARRFALIDRAVDVNIQNQTLPVIIRTGEENRLSTQNLLKDVEKGVAKVLVDRSMDPTQVFEILPNLAPHNADKLMEDKLQCLNEVLGFLGIANNTDSKRERMVRDEVHQATERVNLWRQDAITARQQAVDMLKIWNPEAFKNLEVQWAGVDEEGLVDMDYLMDTKGGE